jgi:hypothetical protein
MTMSEWIFFRDRSVDLRDMEPTDLVGDVFFDLWRTRQQPYSALKDGDTVYFLDRRDRMLIWEFRVRHLLTRRYRSTVEALGLLRSGYGILPEDLNDYVWHRPDEGYLVAWAAEVVRPIAVPLPADVRPGDLGGRTGYLPLERIPAAVLAEMDLPTPGGPAVGPLPAEFAPELVDPRSTELVTRHIPLDVKRKVRARAGNRCEEVGCDSMEEPLHIDHRYPWSKGGTNDLDNLQLLCRNHNLAKGARIPEGLAPPAGPGALERFANAIGAGAAPLPTTLAAKAADGDQLTRLVDALVSDDTVPSEQLAAHALAVQELGTAVTPVDLVRLALHLLSADEELVGIAFEIAQPHVDSADGDVAAAAALVLSYDEELSDEEEIELLRRAAQSTDSWVSGHACFALAERAYDAEHGDGADTSPRPASAQVQAWLTHAADCPDLMTRANAALVLGQLAGDDAATAAGWFRRALVSPDEAVAQEAAMYLAILNAPADPLAAVRLARWALGSPDPYVTDRAHVILAELLGDDEEASMHLLEAQLSDDPDVTEVAAELARERPHPVD